MAYNSSILTSIYGRRLGLQNLSTGQTGGTKGPIEVLVGPEDLRIGVTTNESTGTPMNAVGVSYLVGTSAASTPVFTLSPPIRGLRKNIFFGSTDSALYVKNSAGCSFAGTSLGNTGMTVIRSSAGGNVELIGLTTALFGVLNISSTAVNGVGFQATT
jgi:hypothetical protein